MPTDNRPIVLYVDDEPLNLRVFAANFKHKLRVVTTSSVKEALDILAKQPSEIGIILTDQRMPEMTGVELLEKAKTIVPDAQRMLLTAYSDMQAVLDAVNRGQVSRYFVKPWVKEELLAAMEDLLRIFTLHLRLREVETRMLRSERLATLGQVSAGIAHELMNPVGYMAQNIESLKGEVRVLCEYIAPLLAQRPNPQVAQTIEDMPQLLADVDSGTKHIRKVAHGLRSQARGDDSESSCDLAEAVDFATKMARAELSNRARVAVNGSPVGVVGGSVRWCQVLLNLIVNAAQAMEGTGRQGLIELAWRAKGDDVELTVTDNGKGISASVLPRVFDPMFTTKPANVGTGLGLGICREVVTGLGGVIQVQSTEGVGTVVSIQCRRAARDTGPAGG